MERAALVLRILLIAAAFGAWLPGSLWAMDAGAVRIEYRSVLFSGGIDEGNSGGPLVRGQAVVGLVMGVERGFGLAVPAMSLKIFLDSNEVAWATGAGKGTQIAAAKPQPVRPLTPKAPQPRETFRDCDYCPEMVVVPAGSFRMGSLEGEKGRQDDEGPVHQVRISEPFALGRREVTVAEFRAFVEATDYRTEAEQGNGCYLRRRGRAYGPGRVLRGQRLHTDGHAGQRLGVDGGLLERVL